MEKDRNKEYFLKYFNNYYDRLLKYAKVLNLNDNRSLLFDPDKAIEIVSDTYIAFEEQLNRGLILDKLKDDKIYSYLTTLMWRKYKRPINYKHKNEIISYVNDYGSLNNKSDKFNNQFKSDYLLDYNYNKNNIYNNLEKREIKLLSLLEEGYSFKDIKIKLNLSAKTFKNYTYGIRVKINKIKTKNENGRYSNM